MMDLSPKTPAQKAWATRHRDMPGLGSTTMRRLHMIRQVARLGWGIGTPRQPEYSLANYMAAGGSMETWQRAAAAVQEMIDELEKISRKTTQISIGDNR